jgi:wyosine [tRNA(Phe)-imidazoG37] synthetase (radical SAM superfamily)
MGIIGTFYFDTGKNFNESEIIRFQYENNPFYTEIELPQNTIAVRFDPIEGCWCFLQNLIFKSETDTSLDYQVLNGVQLENNGIFFPTNDPQILIPNINNIKKIKLSCNIEVFLNPIELIYSETKIKQLYSLIEQLRSHIDFLKINKYHSCHYLDRFKLYFETYNDIDRRFVRFCCSALEKLPGSKLYATAQKTVKEIVKIHNNTITESKMYTLLAGSTECETRKYTSSCAKCDLYQFKEWKGNDGLIHYICLTMHPSPCQCRCIYCDNYLIGKDVINDMLLHPQNYEKIFDIIEYLKNNGMIADDVGWQLASGEITIHPFKERIYNLIENQSASFFTNCFIYDESISMNLAANSQSLINLSIDSGTPETWKKIKGFNNFDTVMDNLHKYSASCINPEQIHLKYLILPGINDSFEDYNSFVEIIKNLKVKKTEIACDMRERYSRNQEQSKALIKATGTLFALLKKNNLSYSINHALFSPDESKSSIVFADELLSSGAV